MRCRYCGATIPDGILYCEECGGEVQIVPDYNPLEDMLAAHVKEALKNSRKSSQGGVRSRANAEYGNSGRTAALRSDSGRVSGGARTAALRSESGRVAGGRTAALRSESGRVAGGRTAALRNSSGRTGYIADGRTAALRNGSGRTGYITDGRSRRFQSHTAMLQEEREVQRRQAERRKAQKKKKRRKVLLILFFLLVMIAGIMTALYISSYAGTVYLGNRALRNGEYTKAEDYFRRAIEKDETKAEAYAGLSKVYIGQNDVSFAENLFLGVIEEQPENAAVYEAAFQFYLDTKQPMGIPALLKDAKNSIAEELPEYVVKEPEFSLDENETYDDVQQLSLLSDEGKICYTTDGTMPHTDSTVFTEPIQLSEGTNTIKAIVVNKEGVPSQTAEKEFVIEIPIEDAPAVSPSTGQYDSSRTIEIKVPEGYSAYYTMDGTDPTTASTPYKKPISMPKGETLFKAILVTKSGRVSGITTRNYVRE
jgi:tetratricopeptide (TPR) repeat protein